LDEDEEENPFSEATIKGKGKSPTLEKSEGASESLANLILKEKTPFSYFTGK